MTHILDFEKVLTQKPEISGGKGWNLSRLKHYQFPIPDFRVIDSSACVLFFQYNNLKPAEKIDKMPESDRVGWLKELREMILKSPLPPELESELIQCLTETGWDRKPVSIRSSAPQEDSGKHSFAGIHDSFLNCIGFEQIRDGIRGGYASLWSPRAIAYREKIGLDHKEASMGLVMMEMKDAEASGVAFTCNPHNGREDELVIQAGPGLGEAIVSGQTDPDEYILDLRRYKQDIKSRRPGRHQAQTVLKSSGGVETLNPSTKGKPSLVFNDTQVQQLGRLVQRTAAALNQEEIPIDVEWLYDGKSWWILQARPVTAKPRCTYPALMNLPDHWSNANIKDAVPMVQSTLSRKIFSSLVYAILDVPFDLIHYKRPPWIPYYRLYKGRGYFNLTVLQWSFFDALGVKPDVTNRLTGGHQAEFKIPESESRPLWKKAVRAWRYILTAIPALRMQWKAPQEFKRNRAFCRHWMKKEQHPLSIKEMLVGVDDMYHHSRSLLPTIALINGMSGIPLITLQNTLRSVFGERTEELTHSLMMGAGKIVSAEHGYQLVRMAEIARKDPEARAWFESMEFNPKDWPHRFAEDSPFRKAFTEYLKEFGHRAVYEADMKNPRWANDPSYLLCGIRDMLPTADYKGLKKRQEDTRKAAWKEINQKCSLIIRLLVKFHVGQAVWGAELREQAKSEMIRILMPFQQLCDHIGKELVQREILNSPEDVHHCDWSELLSVLADDWDGAGLKDLIEERKQLYQEWQQLDAPDLIIEDAPQYAPAAEVTTGGYYQGIGAATGVAEGIVRIIRHPEEGFRLKPGEILAAPTTDPGWTPLFLKASGIIVEAGGTMSHGAIVAREFGIPSVLNIPGILGQLKDGQKVRVDGNLGRVWMNQ